MSKKKRVHADDLDDVRREKLENLGEDSYQYKFAMRLKDLIRSTGLTQQAISDRIRDEYSFSNSGSLISNYLYGKVPQAFANIVNLADALGVTCDELLTGNRPEYVALSKELGLSQSAIDGLLSIKEKYSHLMPIVNNLLTGADDPENPLFLILQYFNTPDTDSMLLLTDSGEATISKNVNSDLSKITEAKRITAVPVSELTETNDLTKIDAALKKMKAKTHDARKTSNGFNVYVEDKLTKKGTIDVTKK